MRITKFVAGAPDSSGTFSAAVECVVVNPTEHDVRMIRFGAVVTDSDGFALAHNIRNDVESRIEPGGEETLSPWLTLSRLHCGNETGSLRLTMSCTLYSREHHKIGEVNIPAEESPLARLERKVFSELIDGSLKVNVLRDAEDADGRVGVLAVMLVQSKCERDPLKLEFKCDLLDADGEAVETDSRSFGLDAQSASCIESGFGYLARGQLRGARIRASLYVYRPINVATCSASNTSTDERIFEDE